MVDFYHNISYLCNWKQNEAKMKRKISLFFVILANLVILAHSAVQHHHESDLFESCSISAHKKLSKNNQCPHNDTLKIKHNQTDHTHGLTFEECLLEDLYIRAADNDHNQLTQDLNLNSIILYLPNSLLTHLFPEQVHRKDIYISYIPSQYHSFISQAYGLRAPPIN